MSNVTVSSVSSVQKNHTSRLYCVTRGIRQPLVVWLQSWNDRLLFRKIGRSRELDTSRYFLTAETSPMYQRNHKFWCIACTLKAPTGRCVIQSFGVRIDPNFRPEGELIVLTGMTWPRMRSTCMRSWETKERVSQIFNVSLEPGTLLLYMHNYNSAYEDAVTWVLRS